MGVCNCSMFCFTLLCVRSSIAIILMGKRELVALPKLSSWCLVMVERLFLAVPQGCLRFVIVVFPDHTHLITIFFIYKLFWLLMDRNTGTFAFTLRYFMLRDVKSSCLPSLVPCLKELRALRGLWLKYKNCFSPICFY